jgi:hypothetical protein
MYTKSTWTAQIIHDSRPTEPKKSQILFTWTWWQLLLARFTDYPAIIPHAISFMAMGSIDWRLKAVSCFISHLINYISAESEPKNKRNM